MKDSSKTKQALIEELTELRLQNAELKKSTTGSISAELAAEEARRYAESIVETIRQPLLVLDADLKVMSANQDFYRIFKVNPAETLGNFIYDLGNKQWDIPRLRELLERILHEKEVCTDFEVSHDFEDIGQKIMLLNARQIYRADIAKKLILLVIEDITEPKRLENLLTESEERYRRLFETASDGIVLLEKSEGKITHANPATAKMLGYTQKESIGNCLQDIGVSLDMGDFQTAMQDLNKSGIIHYNDVSVKTKSGQHIDTDIYLVDKARLVQCNIRDITKRKQAQDELRQSEEYFKAIIENSSDIILIVDKLGAITYTSPSIERFLGYGQDELIGKRTLDLIVSDDKSRAIADFGRALLTKDIPIPNIFRIRHKNGTERILEGIGKNLLDNPIVAGLVMNVHDITERKRIQDEMVIVTEIGRVIGATLEIDKVYVQMVTELRKRLLFDSLMVYLIDAQQETLTVTYVYGPEMSGRKVGESFPVRGTTLEEVIRTRRGLIVQSENPEDLIEKFPSLIVSVRTGMRSIMAVPLISRDKMIGNLILRSQKPAAYTERDLHLTEEIGQQIAGAVANAQLYSDLSKTEKSLRESEGRFRSLFEQAAVGVAEIEMSTGRFFTVNRRLCEMVAKTEEELMATTFQAITHPEDLHLHEEYTALLLAGKIGHYSLEKRYIRKDGAIVWVNITVSPLWKPGEEPGRNMIVAEDITERKKAETQLQHTLENLRAAVNTTIQVMVSAVETRDPYTAGHQIRSADLARAIATKMALPQEKIDAIRMSGSIHDIGKLSIPAEILSKPTKLTDIEFSLIKEHARKGYEMLKDVESPWPLAEIVYQHHERMDGSGYPRNLKGDDILIEARILAVADVVEAMASHRPYRPGLGIDAALNEIEKNKGLFYDEAVAEVCLRLFREKGFKLEGIDY